MFSATPLLVITLLAGGWISILLSQGLASGSLVFNLTSSRGGTREEVEVRIRLESNEPPARIISTTVTTDDSGKLVIDKIPASTYIVKLEAVGFDDYSEDNVVVRSGQVTARKVSLDTAQEISLVRLAREKTSEFVDKCSQLSHSPQRVQIFHRAFTDAHDWEKWWHNYGMDAPLVDFKKHSVAAVIQNAHGQPLGAKIGRITYNPRKKRTVVRINQETFDATSVHPTVITCEADFVLLPANPGDVVFR